MTTHVFDSMVTTGGARIFDAPVVTTGGSTGGGGTTGTPVYPSPGQVAAGITYGPTGAEYTGTLTGAAPVLSGVTRYLSVTLKFQGVPQANLTGLAWAFFDQTQPGALSSPAAKGTGATTNELGVFSVALPNSSLAPNGVGYLVVSDTNGTPGGVWRSFGGPVPVLG